MTPKFPPDTDPERSNEADLWFLPGPPDDDDLYLPPLPRAERAPDLIAGWAAAEAQHAGALARVAMVFGALDERLGTAPDGYHHRLALLEAAELSWYAGDRVAADRLAQWVALHLAGAQEDPQGLARAGWALRRLEGGPGPGGSVDELAAFMARQGDAAADWLEAMAGTQVLHPITRAGLGMVLWRQVVPGEAGLLEAAVLAARLAAEQTRGGAVFLPLALAGAAGLRPGDGVAEQLARWYAGAENACLAALLHLDRVARWQQRAQTATAGLSGRTPALLCASLAAWPMLSAPMAEAATGASRAAIQRNLDRLAEAGLIREVTGQGRYRLWAARL